MNPHRLLAPCSLLLLAAPSLSCSSPPEPSTSGGAFFQIQGGDDIGADGKPIPGKFLVCPDGGRSVTIAAKGSDGKDKLLVDGADNSTAICTWTETNFSINVSNLAGTMIVAGSHPVTATGTSMISTDARATIHFPGSTYQTRDVRCTVDFDMNQTGDGKVYGRVTCPKLEHTELSGNACAINAVNGTYFRFANCK